MSIVYNSTKTADTINRAIDNSMGTTTTTQGAAAAGKIITEDLQPVVQCTGGYTNPFIVKTISGVPPVEFHAVESNLKFWSIYGNTVDGVSVGDKTDNMFNPSQTWYATNTLLRSDGTLNDNTSFNVSDYIEVEENTEYYLNNCNRTSTYPSLCFYDENKDYISGIQYNGEKYVSFTTPVNCKYIMVSVLKLDIAICTLNLGDTATDEPYGIKVSIECAGITYKCYISDVLRKSVPVERKRKSKKAVNDTTVYDVMDSTGTVTRNVDTDGTPLETPTTETYTAPTITTIWGYNEFDVDTTVTPSNVTVQYYDN